MGKLEFSGSQECTYHQGPQVSEDEEAVLGSCNGDVQSLQTCQKSRQWKRKTKSYFSLQTGLARQRGWHAGSALALSSGSFFLKVEELSPSFPSTRSLAQTRLHIKHSDQSTWCFQVCSFEGIITIRGMHLSVSYFDLNEILEILTVWFLSLKDILKIWY